jgi:peptidoglycan-associated lipoprotein
VRTMLVRPVLASMTVALVLLAGCAKRPVATVSPAPAPAPAPAAPPPAPAPAPPPPPPVAAPPAPAPAPAPEPARPAPPKEYRANDALKPIYFDFDKSTVRPGDAKILDASAQWLNSNPNYLLLVEGHCDERGTNDYNLALGDKRAKAAMNYLVAQGVKSDRITIVSYGEERPACTEHNEACWAKNRRSQFLIKER